MAGILIQVGIFFYSIDLLGWPNGLRIEAVSWLVFPIYLADLRVWEEILHILAVCLLSFRWPATCSHLLDGCWILQLFYECLLLSAQFSRCQVILDVCFQAAHHPIKKLVLVWFVFSSLTNNGHLPFSHWNWSHSCLFKASYYFITAFAGRC